MARRKRSPGNVLQESRRTTDWWMQHTRTRPPRRPTIPALKDITKTCPNCAETIAAAAITCVFCDTPLTRLRQRKASRHAPKEQQKSSGAVRGISLVAGSALLYLGIQLYVSAGVVVPLQFVAGGALVLAALFMSAER